MLLTYVYIAKDAQMSKKILLLPQFTEVWLMWIWVSRLKTITINLLTVGQNANIKNN